MSVLGHIRRRIFRNPISQYMLAMFVMYLFWITSPASVELTYYDGNYLLITSVEPAQEFRLQICILILFLLFSLYGVFNIIDRVIYYCYRTIVVFLYFMQIKYVFLAFVSPIMFFITFFDVYRILETEREIYTIPQYYFRNPDLYFPIPLRINESNLFEIVYTSMANSFELYYGFFFLLFNIAMFVILLFQRNLWRSDWNFMNSKPAEGSSSWR